MDVNDGIGLGFPETADKEIGIQVGVFCLVLGFYDADGWIRGGLLHLGSMPVKQLAPGHLLRHHSRLL
eukprot:13096977-Ditylum_brightwellii.AAC.1